MKKAIYLLFFFANIGIIFYFWFLRSGGLLLGGGPGVSIALGRICGLLAVYLVLWQLVLIGRVKFLEKIWGLDRLAIWHHLNGLFSWVFIFLHPLFLIIGHGQVNESGFFSQAFDFLFNWDDLASAWLALAVFLLIIILSLGAIKKKIKYEAWYIIHLLSYLAIIWAFEHQLELGTDLQNFIFAVYWYLLYVFAVGLLLYYRFLMPLYLFFRQRFVVAGLEEEGEGVISIYIKGRDLKNFFWQGGQFANFRFLSPSLAWESHPFSFSSAHNQESIRITVKSLGDFSGSLKEGLRIGTPVLIDGPHGVFIKKRTTNKKIALLAGGIGITPIRSLLEQGLLEDGGFRFSLFYCGARQTDLIFRKELEDFSLKYPGRLALHYILSREPQWFGEKGRLDEEKIKRLLPNFKEYDFYLCGPPQMIKNIKKILRRLGIKAAKIYYEKFSFS